eukprot:COSAG01_NODE_2159_length_8277_cov_416.997065_8_plen_109_part_00
MTPRSTDKHASCAATGQSDNGMVSCPPPTTKCHRAGAAGSSHPRQCPGCGLLFVNCSASTGVKWTHNASSGLLQSMPGANAKGAARCLSAHPAKSVGGFYGGPKAALT